MHHEIITKTTDYNKGATVKVTAGSLNGKLAIHKSVGQLGFSLTHIPTGFAIITRLAVYQDAENLMLAIENANWNFRVPHSKIWKAQISELWDVVKDYTDKHEII